MKTNRITRAACALVAWLAFGCSASVDGNQSDCGIYVGDYTITYDGSTADSCSLGLLPPETLSIAPDGAVSVRGLLTGCQIVKQTTAGCSLTVDMACSAETRIGHLEEVLTYQFDFSSFGGTNRWATQLSSSAGLDISCNSTQTFDLTTL